MSTLIGSRLNKNLACRENPQRIKIPTEYVQLHIVDVLSIGIDRSTGIKALIFQGDFSDQERLIGQSFDFSYDDTAAHRLVDLQLLSFFVPEQMRVIEHPDRRKKTKDEPVDNGCGITLSESAWNRDVRIELGKDVRNGIFDQWFDT